MNETVSRKYGIIDIVNLKDGGEVIFVYLNIRYSGERLWKDIILTVSL